MSNIKVVDVSLRSTEEWAQKLGEKYHFTDNEDLMLELVAAFNMFVASNEPPPETFDVSARLGEGVGFSTERCPKCGCLLLTSRYCSMTSCTYFKPLVITEYYPDENLTVTEIVEPTAEQVKGKEKV